MSEGLNAAFGWSAGLVAVVIAILAAVIAIWGHDWVHRVFRLILVFSLPVVTILTLGRHLRRAPAATPPKQHLRVRVRGVHGPVLRGRRVQHHLRALRL